MADMGSITSPESILTAYEEIGLKSDLWEAKDVKGYAEESHFLLRQATFYQRCAWQLKSEGEQYVSGTLRWVMIDRLSEKALNLGKYVSLEQNRLPSLTLMNTSPLTTKMQALNINKMPPCWVAGTPMALVVYHVAVMDRLFTCCNI